MKTILMSCISLVLLSLLFALNSFAQKDFNILSAYKLYPEKSINYFPGPEHTKSVPNENVNKKALRNFKKEFHVVSGVQWFKIDDDFLATYTTGEIVSRSLFNKKGNWIYTIDYSSEKQLPYYIKSMIAHKYYDSKITTVAKIFQSSREIWIVKLVSLTHLITSRIENDEMDEIENFERAN